MYAHASLQSVSDQKPNKLLGLEIIRFISSLSILFWHYQYFSYIADRHENFAAASQPFYSIFRIFYNFGNHGVQVFWCISGFIFFWKYRDAIAEKAINAKKFFNLRFSRLYPLHFLTLILVALLQSLYFSQNDYYFVWQSNDAYHFVLQLFFASNWGFEKGASFNGPIWSISIEVLVYFLFFLTLRYISKSFWCNIGILFFCLIAKYFKITSPIVECLAFFYLGGLTAMAVRYFEKSKLKKPINALIMSLIFIVPLVSFAANLTEYKNFALLFILLFTPILLFAGAQRLKMPTFFQKTIESAGNMTYSIYLIHFPLQLMIMLYFSYTNQAVPYYNPLFFIAFMIITLVLAYFSYYLFELRMQNIIRNNKNHAHPIPQQRF